MTRVGSCEKIVHDLNDVSRSQRTSDDRRYSSLVWTISCGHEGIGQMTEEAKKTMEAAWETLVSRSHVNRRLLEKRAIDRFDRQRNCLKLNKRTVSGDRTEDGCGVKSPSVGRLLKLDEVVRRRETLFQQQIETSHARLNRFRTLKQTTAGQREQREQLRTKINARVKQARRRRIQLLSKRQRAARAVIEAAKRRCKELRAVRQLQRWWKQEKILRRRVRRLFQVDIMALMNAVLPQSGSRKEAQSTESSGTFRDFDTFVGHLCRPAVLKAGAELIHLTCSPPGKRRLTLSQVKQTLTMLMVNRFPDVVLGITAEELQTLRSAVRTSQEQLLLQLLKSSELLEASLRSLHCAVEILGPTSPQPLRKKLSRKSVLEINRAILSLRERRKVFLQNFSKWRHFDSSALVAELLQMYRRIRGTVLEIEEEKRDCVERGVEVNAGLSQFHTGLNGQLERLKTRARELLQSADEFRAWIAAAEQAGERMETKTEMTVTVDSSLGSQPVSEATASIEHTKPKVSTEIRSDANGNLEKAAAMKRETETEAGAGRKQGISASESFWKESQVYELLLDPSYTLTREKSPTGESLGALNDEAAVLLTTALSLKPSANMNAGIEERESDSEEVEQRRQQGIQVLLTVFQNISDRLCALVPHRTDFKTEIQEVLDVDFIQQKLEKRVFSKKDLVQLIEFLGSRILDLQAPARNAETQAWLKKLQAVAEAKGEGGCRTWEDLVGLGLNFVLKELKQIEVDLANFQLKLLATHLLKYEDRSFEVQPIDHNNEAEEKEDEGTRIEGVKYLRGKLEQFNLKEPIIESLRVYFLQNEYSTLEDLPKLFSEVVCDSALLRERQGRHLFPATLARFDHQRVIRLNSSVVKLCQFVSLEILFCQLSTASKVERLNLRNWLSEAVTGACGVEVDQVETLVSSFLAFVDQLDSTLLEDKAARVKVKKAASSVLQQRGPVYSTMLRRFEQLLRACCVLVHDLSHRELFNVEEVLMIPAAQTSKVKTLFAVFKVWKAETTQVIEEVIRMYRTNKLVFNEIYQAALERVLES